MNPNVIFTQPFLVNANLAAKCGSRVVVLDVAFNAGKENPEKEFTDTTQAFITALGDRLVAWVDHHPHQMWKEFSQDMRFWLYDRELAPSMPQAMADNLTVYPVVDTIVCHGDFDGIMAAAMYILEGKEPYEGAILDANAADTRKGELSVIGRWLEEAMKSDIRDDSVRAAVLAILTSADGQAYFKVVSAAKKYAAIAAETESLKAGMKVEGKVAHINATTANAFDLTALLLAGQKMAAVAIVKSMQGEKEITTIAGPKGWDFVKMFGLTGGMPNRVNLPGERYIDAIATVNMP